MGLRGSSHMTKVTPSEGKEQIIAAFEQLLQDHKKAGPTVLTKEKEAQKEKNREIVEDAVIYTINYIIQNLAMRAFPVAQNS